MARHAKFGPQQYCAPTPASMNHTAAFSSLPDAQRLAGIRRGIEKEGLRALSNGGLALTPHPAALGSALTHPHITLTQGVHLGQGETVPEQLAQALPQVLDRTQEQVPQSGQAQSRLEVGKALQARALA